MNHDGIAGNARTVWRPLCDTQWTGNLAHGAHVTMGFPDKEMAQIVVRDCSLTCRPWWTGEAPTQNCPTHRWVQ